MSQVSNAIRIYGRCNIYCLNSSVAFCIKSFASHRVFIQFKHWLIVVDVFCPYHGIEHWCLEKIHPYWSDMTEGLQVLRNLCIWMSCSTYSNYLIYDKCKYLKKCLYLNFIAAYLMSLNSNGYHFLYDNCVDFNKQMWKLLESVSE